MSPKSFHTLAGMTGSLGMVRCPYGGGHAVPTSHLIILADPRGGLDLYAGCIACLVRGIGRIDSPGASVSMDAQARMLLMLAVQALTLPTDYREVGALVTQIRAVLALAER